MQLMPISEFPQLETFRSDNVFAIVLVGSRFLCFPSTIASEQLVHQKEKEYAKSTEDNIE